MDEIYMVLIVILLVVALLGIYFFLKGGSNTSAEASTAPAKTSSGKKWAFEGK